MMTMMSVYLVLPLYYEVGGRKNILNGNLI